MAAVNVTIRGMFYDPYSRVYYQNAVMVGEAFLTDYQVGGGPAYPPSVKPPGEPPGIWGGSNEPFPTPPIYLPPQLPPGVTPPIDPPKPGDPTTPVPPPAGATGWPVQPVVPPSFVIINYPGIGPVVVAPPAPAG